MEAVVYQRMAQQEEAHWWFRGRRAIVEKLLEGLSLPSSGARLLEVGCGTGGNLALLKRFGRLDALEFDEGARHVAERKGGIPVGYCRLPSDIDAPDGVYDVVGLFDVLEHVEDDRGSLRAVARKLKSDGRIVLTVPAYPWLWSSHDDMHHHKRRYTRATLAAAAVAAGLEVETIGSFNTLLFPLAVARRFAKRLVGSTAADDEMPSPAVNRLLAAIFASEKRLVGKMRMPGGLSLYAILRRDRASDVA